MPIAKKLPADLRKILEKIGSESSLNDLREASDALAEFVGDQEDARSEKSVIWHDGDNAAAHQDFIDRVQSLADEIGGVVDAFDEIDFTPPGQE